MPPPSLTDLRAVLDAVLFAPWQAQLAAQGKRLRWVEAPDGAWLYVDGVYLATLPGDLLADLQEAVAVQTLRAALRGEGW